MSKTALGLIETYGYTGAIEAADVCLKAANVSLITCTKVRGGLVTVEIRGDVGAVKAAIDAAEAAVPKVGKLISTHVIPRPADGIEAILDKKEESQPKTEQNQDETLRDKLWDMKVVELRSLARETENIKLSNNDIKYARKEELVDAIAEAQEKGSDK
ncbi:MAG: BMC domain-containing protein [bacterium]